MGIVLLSVSITWCLLASLSLLVIFPIVFWKAHQGLLTPEGTLRFFCLPCVVALASFNGGE
jgi:hypothetical protein